MHILIVLLLAGTDASLVERARTFRSLVESHHWEEARAMMVEEPRRWWGRRDGEGMPWTFGPDAPAPWAAWDEHFESEKEVIRWREERRSATVVIRETNDYFRLLERPPVVNEITYFFDAGGKIEGMLIRGVGDRPPGLTAEFRAWARRHAPEEAEVLWRDGNIDPSDPARFRRLLNRWRAATGRQPVD